MGAPPPAIAGRGAAPAGLPGTAGTTAHPPAEPARELEVLAERLLQVRRRSVELIAPLEPEDLCLQGMADASPPKWHLGHTTWFFSSFVLAPYGAQLLAGDLHRDRAGAWQPPDQRWNYLFNSYYEALGCRQPRPQRGLLTRPPIGAVLTWRQRVDEALMALIASLERCDDASLVQELTALLELGLQHEQQHQELLLMDLLDGFARQPLEPAYSREEQGPEALWRSRCAGQAARPGDWLTFDGGLVEIGHPAVPVMPQQGDAAMAVAAMAVAPTGPIPTDPRLTDRSGTARWATTHLETGPLATDRPDPERPQPSAGTCPDGQSTAFHFDNEAPRHRQWLEPFELAATLVRNAEVEAFIADGGYRRPELWMSEGWAVLQQRGWQAPRYWRGDQEFTLAGLQPRDPAAPVRHLSWFEADAFARWAGARLPTEAEWEHAAASGGLPEAFDRLWQWTASPYRPYPGFQPAAGAVGEYNGKFMTSQFVLRGSCFLTPEGHARLTYRNFYPPASRWMASGLRLAR